MEMHIKNQYLSVTPTPRIMCVQTNNDVLRAWELFCYTTDYLATNQRLCPWPFVSNRLIRFGGWGGRCGLMDIGIWWVAGNWWWQRWWWWCQPPWMEAIHMNYNKFIAHVIFPLCHCLFSFLRASLWLWLYDVRQSNEWKTIDADSPGIRNVSLCVLECTYEKVSNVIGFVYFVSHTLTHAATANWERCPRICVCSCWRVQTKEKFRFSISFRLAMCQWQNMLCNRK